MTFVFINHLSRIMRASWRLSKSRWTVTTQKSLKKRKSQKRKVEQFIRHVDVSVLLASKPSPNVVRFAHSAMDREGKGAGCVELSEVEVLPVHLSP